MANRCNKPEVPNSKVLTDSGFNDKLNGAIDELMGTVKDAEGKVQEDINEAKKVLVRKRYRK